jgi:flagellar hook-basal body protein
MKVQQTKMDVIGDNIANVGTYGFKASRATFRSTYYQTAKAASAPTGAKGGVNATQVGVGSKLGSIDTNHSQSVMTTTGFGLDIAIAGEGYLQVQDKNGNIFYTKAGMLDIDNDGNLVDVNGNFVLGVSGDPYTQEAGSNRIAITLPNAPATAATATEPANNKNLTITTTEKTELANVTINFRATNNLPLNNRVRATASSGALLIEINENEIFSASEGDATAVPPVLPTTWLDDFQQAVNDAVKEAYGGESVLGDLQIEIDDPNTLEKAQYTGADIISTDYSYSSGGLGVMVPTKNPNSTGQDDGYLDEAGEATDLEGAARTLKFDSSTTSLPGAWGELDFSIESTGSDFGREWSSTLLDPDLNRKVSDVIMNLSQADLNADGVYDGKDDGLTFTYFVMDAAGPTVQVPTGIDADTGAPTYEEMTGWLYTSTQQRAELESGGSVTLKLDVNTEGFDVEPSQADSITIGFPKLAKMQNGVTESGDVDWNKYFINSQSGATGWDLDKDGVYGDTLTNTIKAVASDPARALGFGANPFKLTGGTNGGPQTAADLTSIGISDTGVLSGEHATLGYMEFGRIDLATFANPAGLTQVGNTYFEESANSGEPKVVMPGSAGTGSIAASTLETSNVDLSNEFSDMILTQRGFQASSRMITVSDSMLEELINLKR